MKYRALKRFLFLSFCGMMGLFIAGCGGGGGGGSSNGSSAGDGGAAPSTGASVNAPSSIVADAGVQRVTLTWSPVVNATTFNVYYATQPGVTKTTGTKVLDQHAPCILRNLTNGTPYYFVITAVNASGESNISAEVSATPSATPPPPAPTNVTAAGETGQVRVSWTLSIGAASYAIYYGTSPNVTKATGTKISNATNPQVVGSLTNSTAYYFVVTALDGANRESAVSFEVSATPLASPPPPVPTGLGAVEGNQQITVTWSPAAGATSYNLYYANDIFVSKRTGIKIANVTSPLLLSSLTNKTMYFFVVTAVNSNGESAESAPAAATPLAAKPVPSMVLIPGGPFQMGDNLDATAHSLPVHTVNVDAFHIDRYETMHDLWKGVYDWAVLNGYSFDNPGTNGTYNMGTNMPVTQVSWYDVLKWLNARSEREGRTPVYYTDATQTTVYRTGQVDVADAAVKWSANGYRLPTEAEWEKADRGGLVGKRYPWGDDLGTGNANDNMGEAVSVGLYPPNGYGLYDLAGNVWEWTWDLAVEADAYTWATNPITNPHGQTSGTTRVRRGGTYAYGSQYLRCYERMFRVPTYSAPYFGFRSASNQP